MSNQPVTGAAPPSRLARARLGRPLVLKHCAGHRSPPPWPTPCARQPQHAAPEPECHACAPTPPGHPSAARWVDPRAASAPRPRGAVQSAVAHTPVARLGLVASAAPPAATHWQPLAATLAWLSLGLAAANSPAPGLA